MGTSVNQSSANSPSWAVAQAGYKGNIPIDRVVQEIWRAATHPKEGDLARLLAQPIVARIGQIAFGANSPDQVASATNREITRSKAASLASDIAQRAAIQCVLGENRAQIYGERVFAEACNYLLSRDLPGFVGGTNRNRTVADSLAFKRSILDSTTRAVQTAGRPDFSTERTWRRYVEAVLTHLRGHAK